tara:strand:+ start:526 stop:1095 length:570 start_codon:yes stop_codon:yes gene_type:complete
MYPVFPLNIVILPNESVALHLFEPRYKELFQDCKDGGEFVIVHKGKNGLAKMGTLVFIEKVINEYPDDTVDLIVQGITTIEIEQFIDFFPNKLYSAVKGKRHELSNKACEKLKNRFFTYMASIGKKISNPERINLFYIANRIELNLESKLELISLTSNEAINKFLLHEIQMMEKIQEQESWLQQKFHLN